MSYEQGFIEKCAEFGANPDAVAYDLTLVKVAQAIEASPIYEQWNDLKPEDFTGDYVSQQLDQYYGGPEKLREEFGPFASTYYDDEKKRSQLYDRLAKQLRRMKEVQMAYQARGMEMPNE